MSEKAPGTDNLIFALDIGTRSVIGVVGTAEDGMFRVMEVEVAEHTRRAVVDGQIEDIEETARVAALVKERLEAKLGFTLGQVHVAAAGRVLRTIRASSELALDGRRPIDARQVFTLEADAVAKAHEMVISLSADEGEDIDFICVGHTVTRYSLDGYSFSTLEGHRGKRASVELVATFLPSEVVESLYATMHRVGLTISSLTLEPIAAINVVIPDELRLLNVALVDVGAGTSDIALTREGSVSAYTMATVAGDEITECVMRGMLVDFQMAEQMKFALSAGQDTIAYTDILGFPGEVSAQALADCIEPAVEQLAQTVARRILEANTQPPMAIFMVGGGSRTPGLCPRVAKHVGLDPSKVAIGGSNYMKRLVDADPAYLAADYTTPMGIGVCAAAGTLRGGFRVMLNNCPVRIQSSSGANVMEALLRAGYKYEQIMGRSGRSLTFFVNGQRTTVRGQPPTLAQISLNGRPASVATSLSADDVLTFEPAQNGTDADARVCKAIRDYGTFSIYLDGEKKPAGTLVRVAGIPVGPNYLIRPMEAVELRRIVTLGDVLADPEYGARHGRVALDGRFDCPLDTPLKEGDRVDFMPEAFVPPRPAAAKPDTTLRDEASLEPPAQSAGPALNITLNGQPLRLDPKPGGYLFFDVLAYTDIDPTRPQGDIAVLRNGRDASYIEPIAEGDSIEIYWKKSGNFTNA